MQIIIFEKHYECILLSDKEDSLLGLDAFSDTK